MRTSISFTQVTLMTCAYLTQVLKRPGYNHADTSVGSNEASTFLGPQGERLLSLLCQLLRLCLQRRREFEDRRTRHGRQVDALDMRNEMQLLGSAIYTLAKLGKFEGLMQVIPQKLNTFSNIKWPPNA